MNRDAHSGRNLVDWIVFDSVNKCSPHVDWMLPCRCNIVGIATLIRIWITTSIVVVASAVDVGDSVAASHFCFVPCLSSLLLLLFSRGLQQRG